MSLVKHPGVQVKGPKHFYPLKGFTSAVPFADISPEIPAGRADDFFSELKSSEQARTLFE